MLLYKKLLVMTFGTTLVLGSENVQAISLRISEKKMHFFLLRNVTQQESE